MMSRSVPFPAPGSHTVEFALWYADQGWPVLRLHGLVEWRDGLPCRCLKGVDCGSAGKHPKSRNWPSLASTDPEVIRRWWNIDPLAGVGIVTGRRSGLVVVDIDPRNGGDETVRDLEQQHGSFPSTIEVLSGGGGRHLYFDAEDQPYLSASGALGDGVDVKAEGGMIVASPTLHQSGKRYEWEVEHHPEDTELALLPEWAKTKLREHSDRQRHVLEHGRIDPALVLAGVSDGERNDTLFRYACSLRAQDVDVLVAFDKLRQAAANCDPPLPQHEVDELLRSVYTRYEAGVGHDGALVESTQPRSRSARLPIVWGNDIEDLPQPEWIIDSIIPAGAFVVLYGAAATGKTFIALDMAAAISTGQPWHEHETRRGTVIYIAAEGVGDLGLRHQAVRIGRNLDDLPEVGYLLEPVNLFSQSDVEHLDHTLAGRRPALIIADTLARSMDGGDENVVKDMNVVIKNVDYLRRTTGAAMMLIHHTGHDKSRERGSSALKGAADVFIRLNGDVIKSVTLSCDKMKMSKAFDEVILRFEPTGDSLAVVSHPVTPVLDGHEQASLTLVSHDPLTHKAWLEVFEKAGHGSRSSFNRALNTLREKGFVDTGVGTGANEYIITEAGQVALGLTGAKKVSDAK